MGTPQLDIDAGAVSDISNNQIAAAPDQPIAIDNSDSAIPVCYNLESRSCQRTPDHPSGWF